MTQTPPSEVGAETPDDAEAVVNESPLDRKIREVAEATSSLDGLLRDATRHCQRQVGASSARIWISRSRGRRLVTREFGDDGATVERRLVRGEGLAGWVVQHRKPLRLAADTPRPELEGALPTFRSALVMPLFRRGEVFGAIECLDKRDADGFSDEDHERLEVSAEHIAFALDNALLYEETEKRALEKEVLLQVSRTIATPLDLDEVIEAIFKALWQVVNFDAAAIYLVDRKSGQLEPVSSVGFPEGSEERFKLEIGQGIVGWVAKTAQPQIVPDVATDPHYVQARSETRSEIAAPMVLENRVIGVFNLESNYDDTYHEGHLEIVGAIAAQAAVAVERAYLAGELLERRHLEKELAIARDIQLSFLPKQAPEIPGFDVAGTTRSHAEVGGDYYDFIHVTDTRLGLAIADVSGKGIPAALIMAGLRTSLLAEIRNEFAIRAIMRKVNSLIYESTARERFVTAFYGLLDHKNRVLIFCNAGHNPPILMRRDGRVEHLVEGGMALGILPDARYEERPIGLRPGDIVVLYTDGVSEAMSPTKDEFGVERIETTVARLADRPAAEILEGLVGEVLEWTGRNGPNDDLTVMVVKAGEV